MPVWFTEGFHGDIPKKSMEGFIKVQFKVFMKESLGQNQNESLDDSLELFLEFS